MKLSMTAHHPLFRSSFPICFIQLIKSHKFRISSGLLQPSIRIGTPGIAKSPSSNMESSGIVITPFCLKLSNEFDQCSLSFGRCRCWRSCRCRCRRRQDRGRRRVGGTCIVLKSLVKPAFVQHWEQYYNGYRSRGLKFLLKWQVRIIYYFMCNCRNSNYKVIALWSKSLLCTVGRMLHLWILEAIFLDMTKKLIRDLFCFVTSLGM